MTYDGEGGTLSPMGLWERQVVPRLINACNNGAHLKEIRARTCATLSGEVVEIGFGSGLNAPYYPPAVDRVLVVEPSDVGWGLAADRVRDAPVPVERVGLDWTLCRVGSSGAAGSPCRSCR